jgi:hypothetical protein
MTIHDGRADFQRGVGAQPNPVESGIGLGVFYAAVDGHAHYKHPSGTDYALTPPSGGAGSGVNVSFNNVPLGMADTLNFSGIGVNVELIGSQADIVISASSSGTGIAGIGFQDEGVPLGTITSINFSGAGVSAVMQVGSLGLVIIPGIGGNLDGGAANSVYGGTTGIDGGGA